MLLQNPLGVFSYLPKYRFSRDFVVVPLTFIFIGWTALFCGYPINKSADAEQEDIDLQSTSAIVTSWILIISTFPTLIDLGLDCVNSTSNNELTSKSTHFHFSENDFWTSRFFVAVATFITAGIPQFNILNWDPSNLFKIHEYTYLTVTISCIVCNLSFSKPTLCSPRATLAVSTYVCIALLLGLFLGSSKDSNLQNIAMFVLASTLPLLGLMLIYWSYRQMTDSWNRVWYPDDYAVVFHLSLVAFSLTGTVLLALFNDGNGFIWTKLTLSAIIEIRVIKAGNMILLTVIPGRILKSETVFAKDKVIQTKTDFTRYMSHEMRTPLNVVSLGLALISETLQPLLPPTLQSPAPQSPIPAIVDMQKREMQTNIAESDSLITKQTFNAVTSVDSPSNIKATATLNKTLSEVWELLDNTASASAMALDLLENLMIYDKLESGLATLNKQRVDVISLVDEIARMFRMKVRDANTSITIINGVSDKFEPVTNTSVIEADRNKLRQILCNLISNAVKFASKSGEIIVILGTAFEKRPQLISQGNSSTNTVQPNTLVIQVSDNGVGISPENQKRLFCEIVQFRPEVLQGGGGSGLGMWISKRIVDMHEGTISVFSEGEGKGTTFTVKLPMTTSVSGSDLSNSTLPSDGSNKSNKPGSDVNFDNVNSALRNNTQQNAIELNQLKQTAIHSNGKSGWNFNPDLKPRLLLVDDSEPIRKMMRRALERGGYECVEAVDGIQAVELMTESLKFAEEFEKDHSGANALLEEWSGRLKFDAVLIDYIMPKMDGPTSTREIRKLGYIGPIIGVTGQAMSNDISKFKQSGIDQILIKPVTSDALYESLQLMGIFGTTTSNTEASNTKKSNTSEQNYQSLIQQAPVEQLSYKSHHPGITDSRIVGTEMV